MPGTVPNPTLIRRFIYLPNLAVYLKQGGLHAPNTLPPNSGWIPTHNTDLQSARGNTMIFCGPRGTIHEYIPFYFGTHTPMMLQLHTGQVNGYEHGQKELIYLVSTAQAVQGNGLSFVFSDGHGYTAYTKWFDDLAQLCQVDWDAVGRRYWGAPNDPTGELQRKKQAEFLVHRFMDWAMVDEIAVYDAFHQQQVQALLDAYGAEHRPLVVVRRNWYF